MAKEAFFAFPSQPREIPETIERALILSRGQNARMAFFPWTSLDVAGRPISQAILSRINTSSSLIADISVLNPNVSYEIGYAIGGKKAIQLTINRLYQTQTTEQLRQIGLFDTVGYHIYDNSEDLAEYLINSSRTDGEPMFVPEGFDKN